MVPDLEGFFLMQSKKTFSHSLPGIFFFDLPVGILFCFLWHNLIKRDFIDYSLFFVKKRLYRYRDFDWNKYFRRHKIVVLVSLLIGIVTHLIWDSQTHFYGKRFDAITVFKVEMAKYIFWQYVNSIAGLIVVLFFLAVMPVDKNVPKIRNAGYWFIVTQVAGITIYIRFLCYKKYYYAMTEMVEDLLVVFISSFMLGIVCASLCKVIFRPRLIT